MEKKLEKAPKNTGVGLIPTNDPTNEGKTTFLVIDAGRRLSDTIQKVKGFDLNRFGKRDGKKRSKFLVLKEEDKKRKKVDLFCPDYNLGNLVKL